MIDETSGRWVSRAEVAEIDFTAFAAQKKSEHVPGRLVVRRIPDFNAEKNKAAGQDTLFDVWRFHAFFTTADPDLLGTVTVDKTHRGHAVIEQVHADLKNSALAHLPSGVFSPTPPGWSSRSSRSTSARCWHPRSARPGEGDHCDPAPQADHRASTGGDLGSPDHRAPPEGLALGNRLDGAVRQRQRPATPPRGLAIQQHRCATPGPKCNPRTARSGRSSRPQSLTRAEHDHPTLTMPIGGSRPIAAASCG